MTDAMKDENDPRAAVGSILGSRQKEHVDDLFLGAARVEGGGQSAGSA